METLNSIINGDLFIKPPSQVKSILLIRKTCILFPKWQTCNWSKNDASMASSELLINTLGKATSQDPHILKAAEEQLKAWELQPEFFLALLVCMSADKKNII